MDGFLHFIQKQNNNIITHMQYKDKSYVASDHSWWIIYKHVSILKFEPNLQVLPISMCHYSSIFNIYLGLGNMQEKSQINMLA